jgi:hypothetical protein
MLALLIVLIVAVIIFALLWYLVTIIPLPAPIANFRWVFYVLLILVAILWLADRFLGGVPGLK